MTIRQSDVDTAVLTPFNGSASGFKVRRVLPSLHRRMIGPFVLVDQMGPADLDPGHGFDLAPHPHIGMETITYLIDGEITIGTILAKCRPPGQARSTG
jgi:redox-sensitive bicupin YhaK (pirin superfamily)